ncbi:IclR family transcriptional regulator [Roseisalinus antarcticus]|uniref:Transcriptional regulator KdgR n=1 Tax=Roseisalinus antarcticus TaxID=254357 RepID=A0A1Y5RTB4_9RHOB|nr:IclR family transcriptional regulator [Roseisalinus antarcticus]SLN24532.1 Transcriptional regulator KdgR [Roseisalinus antarcticus]
MATAGGGTIGKALEVLDSVAAFGRPVRFGELLEGSPFPKATLFRFVQTLAEQGMLAYDPDRQTYAPGVRLVRLAHSAWAQSSLGAVARPHLDSLAAKVGETVHLAQLDRAQVLYVDKRNASSPVEMFSDAGKVGPAYCTGVGKAMLAFEPEQSLERIIAQQSFHRFTEHTYTTPEALRAELAQIRARGHAYDREEHEPGIICIAVPILTSRGRCLGALSITGSTARTSLSRLDGYINDLRATARGIAEESKDWRFPQTDTCPKGPREDET